MSVHERFVYRDRDGGERVEYQDNPRRSYTTVKRYQVPDTARQVFEPQEEQDNKVVIRRKEASPARSHAPSRSYAPTRARENIDIDIDIHEREREPRRRDIPYRVLEQHGSDYERYPEPRSSYRVVDRKVVRRDSTPSPERVREWRFQREREFSPPRREERPYDLERYSKSTEYFAQPQPAPQPIIIREAAAPQPIIIREERREQAPIIIREERREPQYEFIEREEVKDESRSLVRREELPPPAPAPPLPEPEENYFYERRVRELDRPRSDVRPRDSASRASHYSSDDSYEYVRRERTYDDDGRSRRSSHSPHHKRHLAEGAIAGLGAAEIFGHHQRKEGKGGHRVGRDVAGAALGAVGAEAISRVRSKSRRRRSRSRSRSSSFDRYRDRPRRRRSRSRSRGISLSRAQKVGGLAAVAGVAALAGYALKNRNKNNETVIVNETPRRSRSRRRRASVDSYMSGPPLSERSGSAMNPKHRNKKIAQAGLASAAAAGIWEKVRSRSRGGRSRSKSRVRQGAPIAAAGLGGAALAGLYEKNKGNKEAKKAAAVEEELRRGRRRRSRSRSRSIPAPYPASERGIDERPMIAYGHEPVYPEQARGYYSDDEPGMYRRRHGRGSSSGSSPDTRRRSRSRRSRSRGKDLAAAGAAAGVAGVAAHEYGKRRERSRHREAEHRREYPRHPLPLRGTELIRSCAHRT